MDPAACDACHQLQYADWQTALHSRAMSPGLFGQLQEMDANDVDEHQACLRCHAPLAEQGEDLQHKLKNKAGRGQPRSDGAISAHGLTCAGCHVRNHRRFGSPRRDGSTASARGKLPHNGWQASNAFENSLFCAACHQFTPADPGLNGKPFENTYGEWKQSRHAGENHSCQSCHMPNRRHLWRGIHDPEMVRSGLTIETSRPSLTRGMVSVQLKITSNGIGHDFPTYVTPRVPTFIVPR